MGIYYYLVNKDLKEYVDAGELDLGLKTWSYRYHISTLLGFLCMDEYNWDGEPDEQYKNEKEFYFLGHWSGCPNIQLVSEYNELYDEISEHDHHGTENGWVDITLPVAREWNEEIKEWYGDSDSPETLDWLKHHLYDIRSK